MTQCPPQPSGYWPLSHFQTCGLVLGRCRHGWMLWPEADDTIGRCLALYGEFAEAEVELMRRYVAPGDCVVDVGANLGCTVLPLSAAVGTEGQVLAFEPQPLMAQCLQTALTLNDRCNVRVQTAALGAASGWASLAMPAAGERANFGAASLAETGLRVPVMRLDDLALDRCNLVKIDVEGFEWQVLQGAAETLLRCRPVLVLEAKRIPGTSHGLRWLMDHGWRCYWHFAFFFRSGNFKGDNANVFGDVGDMNVLALPGGRADQPRDLPEIATPEEDWRDTYSLFFSERGLPIPR